MSSICRLSLYGVQQWTRTIRYYYYGVLTFSLMISEPNKIWKPRRQHCNHLISTNWKAYICIMLGLIQRLTWLQVNKLTQTYPAWPWCTMYVYNVHTYINWHAVMMEIQGRWKERSSFSPNVLAESSQAAYLTSDDLPKAICYIFTFNPRNGPQKHNAETFELVWGV